MGLQDVAERSPSHFFIVEVMFRPINFRFAALLVVQVKISIESQLSRLMLRLLYRRLSIGTRDWHANDGFV